MGRVGEGATSIIRVAALVFAEKKEPYWQIAEARVAEAEGPAVGGAWGRSAAAEGAPALFPSLPEDGVFPGTLGSLWRPRSAAHASSSSSEDFSAASSASSSCLSFRGGAGGRRGAPEAPFLFHLHPDLVPLVINTH